MKLYVNPAGWPFEFRESHPEDAAAIGKPMGPWTVYEPDGSSHGYRTLRKAAYALDLKKSDLVFREGQERLIVY